MVHFLSANDAIKSRVRDALDGAGLGAVRVFGAAELGRPDGSVPMPAVFVVLDGVDVLESAAQGRQARLGQRWLVVAAARNVARLQSGEDARDEVGPVADVVLGALMGWQPDGVCAPLGLVPGPAPIYRDGVFYLPLAFRLELVRRSAP